MHKHAVNRLPVIEENGKAIGIVSGRDVRVAVGVPHFDKNMTQEQFENSIKAKLASIKVSQVMSKPLKTCAADDSAVDAAKLMRVGIVSSLVVVNDQGFCVGIVTRSDLLDEFIRVYEPPNK